MNKLEEAKKKYEEIPIPEELSKRVEEAIRSSEEKRKKNDWKKRKKYIIRSIEAAAAGVAIFIVALNTNTVFAREMSTIPVIGTIARVLTFRNYEKEEEDLKISVEIPSIEMIEEDTNGLSETINQEIYNLCEQYAEEAIERAEEYKKAFLDTGGTEEEWAEHHITIKVWYEVKAQTEEYLSLAIRGSENWTSAYSEVRYYNIDLREQKLLTLKDMLGENYISIANESIQAQMNDSDIHFWSPEEGGFTSISDSTKFYINEFGNPVIVFEKYEIAPGSEGEIEFEIKNTRQGETENDLQNETENLIQSNTKETQSQTEENQEEKTYKDNFSVDTKAVAEFAGKVKSAVAEQNLTVLADLASYPLYVGFEDGGISVNSKEELIALGDEQIFTLGLTESVKAADETALTPSMAGFVLTDGGTVNIIFGVSDGELKIKGINY